MRGCPGRRSVGRGTGSPSTADRGRRGVTPGRAGRRPLAGDRPRYRPADGAWPADLLAVARRLRRSGSSAPFVRLPRGAAAVHRVHLRRRGDGVPSPAATTCVQRGDGADAVAQPGEAMRYFVATWPRTCRRCAGRRGSLRALADPGAAAAACRSTARWRPPGRPVRLGDGVRGVGPCLRALGRQGLIRRAGRRRGADGGARRHRRPGCRAVGAPSGWPAAPRCWLIAAVAATTLPSSTRSRRGERWLAELGDDLCAAVLDAEPAPVVTIDGRFRRGARGGSPTSPTSSRRGCAATRPGRRARGDAAGAAGLSGDERRDAAGPRSCTTSDGRRAHGIWDRPGPLTVDQWERVRLHPYLTERVLRRLPRAHTVRRCRRPPPRAGRRLGLPPRRRRRPARHRPRLLAAADAYHAMTEDRPHRPALSAPRRRAAARDVERRPLRRARSTPCSPPPARHGRAGAGRHPGRSHRPGGRGAAPDRPGPCQQAGRRDARHLGQDGRPPRRAHLRQGRRHTRAGATLFAMEHGLLSS